jgi:hypothetical protein
MSDLSPPVTLSLSFSKAEHYRDATADVLCWLRGFLAARPDDSGLLVDSVNALSLFNADLKDAISRWEREPI